jgi:molecular chaperone GrpE
MPEQAADNIFADAALESIAAEGKAKADKPRSPGDQKMADLEEQLREAGERVLRAQAELENYRKRSQRELIEERRYAIVPFARDLLPVVDNLERAIEAAQAQSAGKASPESAGKAPGAAMSSLLEGVQMVATQLDTVLKQHHCERIETVGTPFDPNQHQAIAQEPSDEYPSGIVTRAMQAGYKLHDRVIRPAQVFVSTGSNP